MNKTIILIFLSLSLLSKAQTDTTESEGTMFRYQTMPSFKEGSSKFMTFVNTLAVYNEKAKLEKAEGRVYVSFFVETDGSLTEIELARGIQSDLDSIAISIVNRMDNKWKPGTQGGRPVRIKYMFPVNFNLANTSVNEPSKYWEKKGRKKFEKICQTNLGLTEKDKNYWYNFIISNYNQLKIDEIDLKLMIENFK